MYSILDLNKKLVADLRDIASVINVNGADKLKKAELIEAILNEQKNHKENGTTSEKSSDDEPKKKRKRVRIHKDSNEEHKASSMNDFKDGKVTKERDSQLSVAEESTIQLAEEAKSNHFSEEESL